MSILIKGMDMPKDFFRCPFAHVGQTLSKTLCRVDAKNPKYCCGVGNDGCPLVEIPKHGRLVDASKITNNEDIILPDDLRLKVEICIASAPTVIEAEE